MSITRKSDGWWIESPSLSGGACGPYRTKAEAAEDRAGLARFFRDHPEYREDQCNGSSSVQPGLDADSTAD